MWDLPGPGLEPGSPALAGGFLTTTPPGKSELVISEWKESGTIWVQKVIEGLRKGNIEKRILCVVRVF